MKGLRIYELKFELLLIKNAPAVKIQVYIIYVIL